jgi:hypothetical protein
MGIGVNVSCPCFGSFVLQVGPRIAPPKYSLFPFMCTDCQGTSCLDIYGASLACSQCGSLAVIPYGRPPALGELGPNVIFGCSPTGGFSAEELTITDGSYWCPTCRRHTSRFTDAGIRWD